jgi:glucose/arabinose dehydrogenase
MKWIAVISALLLVTEAAQAATGGLVTFVQVPGTFADPIGVTNAGDGSNRLFVVERAGTIRVVKNGQLLVTPFLNISSLINCTDCGERGLLGLAFHPDYENNGDFFVFYTRTGGDLVVARYEVSANPDVANAGSAAILLVVDHPRTNHNGGQLAFGPDGYLYIGTGDGGGGGDPDENGQNINTLLGKILRIDVDGADAYPSDPDRNYAIPANNPFAGATPGADEVWAYGLRNPWRFSFDRQTGDLYIGDVGQVTWEEIDFQPAASGGGENYGWDCREGAHNYTDGNGDLNAGCPVASVDPILEYSHSLGCSVTGGFVYRGGVPSFLSGEYLYGDFCTGRIWRGFQDPDWESEELFDTSFGISSFGESETGRIYFTDLFGDSLRWFAIHTYSDVSPTSGIWPFVEAIAAAGVTGGCGGTSYCPGTNVTRAQMAVFLLAAEHGPGYTPPPATGTVFNDVPANSFAAAWIEQLAAEGITGGCGNGNYCPNDPVTREQMAAFLLAAREGSGYVPPACTTPSFSDVPCSNPFAPAINEIADRGITGGCGGGNYCPDAAVTRGQMAVFLAATFGLPLP